MSRYPIPKGRTRVELRVSNSRFIASLAPASTVKDAQQFVRALRAEMPDATHHVYAFKVGYGASVSEGMSDDGEPSGTAGPPALAVLRGANVGDVVLVITRYFGGTKLGTGGLVSAYTAAAQAAFEGLETELKVERIRLEVTAPYAVLEQLRRLLAQHEAQIEDEQFAAEVTLRFLIPTEQEAALSQAIQNLTAGQVTPRRTEDNK